MKHVPGFRGTANPGVAGSTTGSASGPFSSPQALRLHWLFAYLFMANGALYLAGLTAGGGWRALLPRASDCRGRSRDDAVLRRGDSGEAILRRPWPHPPVRSKYNALQRGAYFSMPVLGVLALASGWAMHKPVQLCWLERLFVSYDGARIVHFWVMVDLRGVRRAARGAGDRRRLGHVPLDGRGLVEASSEEGMSRT